MTELEEIAEVMHQRRVVKQLPGLTTYAQAVAYAYVEMPGETAGIISGTAEALLDLELKGARHG
jgi:hypothetical protein